jgi:DNA (cytosine-5)-methyltransferase 1
LVAAKCLTTSQERQDYDTQGFVTGSGVRRLTPSECESLQGFPRGWTIPDGTDWREYPRPDGPRYAQMGNAVTVPVIEWIGRRIMEYGA